MKQLDEIIVKKEFDVEEAHSSVAFYWNLLRQRGKSIKVLILEEEVPCEAPSLQGLHKVS